MQLPGWSRSYQTGIRLYRTLYNNVPSYNVHRTHSQTHKLTGVLTYAGASANSGKNEGNSSWETRSWERRWSREGRIAGGKEKEPEKQHQNCASYVTMFSWKAPPVCEAPISGLAGEPMTDHLFKGQIYKSMTHLGPSHTLSSFRQEVGLIYSF